MTTWRMAMRAGNQGPSMWPQCFKLGVAAITYPPDFIDVDLSQHEEFEPHELWANLESTQHASLARVAYKMQKGDIIYVKEGPKIVGRGVVQGSYQYDRKGRIVDPYGNPWRHQVPVKWDVDFEPIDILLGAEPTTVLQLSGKRLRKLEREIAKRRRGTPTAEAAETTEFVPASAGAGFRDARIRKEVEDAAISVATKSYRSKGWTVVSVERDKCGYDLRCTKNEQELHLEVKGISGDIGPFLITAGEVKRARVDPAFMLCIVTHATSAKPKIHKYTGGQFLDRFKREPLVFKAIPRD